MYNGGFDISMTGMWVNPQTGDKFEVEDVFFEDGQLLIKTKDGRMLDYNITSSYVRSDEKNVSVPINDNKENVNNNNANLLGNLYNKQPVTPSTTTITNNIDEAFIEEKTGDKMPINNVDEEILNRLFNDEESKLKYIIKVETVSEEGFKNKINMATNTLNIDPKVINKWIISREIKNSLNILEEEITKKIESIINSFFDSKIVDKKDDNNEQKKNIKKNKKITK